MVGLVVAVISKHLVYFLEGEDQLVLPPGLLRLLFLQFLGALAPDVLHSCLHLVPHHGLLLLVQVVFLPQSLFLHATPSCYASSSSFCYACGFCSSLLLLARAMVVVVLSLLINKGI